MRTRRNGNCLSVCLYYAAFPYYTRIDYIIHRRLGRSKTEHSRENNAQTALLSRRVLYLYSLCLGSVGHTVRMRENEKCALYFQPAFRLVCYFRIVAKMSANSTFYICLDISRIENLRAVFHYIKLAVYRLAVILGRKRISRRRDLPCRARAK